MRQDIVLYSGGPDSYITYRFVTVQGIIPHLMYFKLGHRYQEAELEAIDRTLPSTLVVDVLERLGVWEQEDAFIYGRNAFLALAASKYMESDGAIWLTVQRDEMDLADRSPRFLRDMTNLLIALSGKLILVQTPWEESDKTDMVRWYVSNGFSVPNLLRTRSCYRASENELQCGNCAACFRRAVAFRLNGIEEEYQANPFTSETAMEYHRRALSKEYSTRRCIRILDAIERFGDD